MAFTLQAFIGEASHISQIASLGVQAVALPQSKAMVPLTRRVREVHEIPFLPLTDGGAAEVPPTVATLAARARKVAYVEAEHFGGAGMQAAAIWEDGRLVFGPVVADDAINQALRQLCVSRDSSDEFDALQLDRCRDTEEWR